MRTTPTSKTILVLLLIAVLAVIGFFFYTHRSVKNIPEPSVSENAPLPSSTEWPSTKLSDQTIKDNSSYYTISAVYPVTKDDVITGYFKTFVENAIAQFKDDTSWAAGDGAAVAPAEAEALSLDIKYTEEKSNKADTYIFAVTTYTGGAHGLEVTKTFSFSPTGQQITVASLFTNGDDGLKTIAPYIKTQLMKGQYADASMINDGTAPTADNYQSFTIENDGVTFIFDPYQVAAYAAGQQKVKVPLSVFKGIASSNIFATQ